MEEFFQWDADGRVVWGHFHNACHHISPFLDDWVNVSCVLAVGVAIAFLHGEEQVGALVPENTIVVYTLFLSEMSNKYFDSWITLVGADGYTPIAGSPLLNTAPFTGWTGFDKVKYIGAFDGTDNWMAGWTNFDLQNTKY